MKTLVLGMGNAIRGDDSAGLKVVDRLRSVITSPDVVLQESDISGLGLLETLVGYDRAVIVDAIHMGGETGKVHRLTLNDLPTNSRAPSLHALGLARVMEMGRQIGLALPRHVVIVGIEIPTVNEFSEDCSDEVSRAIPVAVEMVLREMEGVPCTK